MKSLFKESTIKILELFFDERKELLTIKAEIVSAIIAMITCYQNGGKILVCGNGGSAADSEHIVGELLKSFRTKRPMPKELAEKAAEKYKEHGEYLAKYLEQGLPAISLVSQTSFITAFLNDSATDIIFAQQVYAYMKKDDILIAISTSGNSKSVCHALRTAKLLNGVTIGLTGKTGGLMKDYCDIGLLVPETMTYKIQELHLPVYHLLCAAVENEFFGD